VNFSRLRLSVGFALVLGIATATAGLAQFGSNPEAPPPPATPVPTEAPVDTSTPAPASSSRPRRGKRAPGPAASGSPAPGASDTPEPPQFTTLDGIWEIEMQPLGKRLANYSHLSVTATGANLTGYWEHDPKKTRSPLKGTFDGRLISLQIDMPDGSTSSFTGYVEGFADMVGIFRTKDVDPGTAFTAEHRKKLKG
jgi:hypothetical protein